VDELFLKMSGKMDCGKPKNWLISIRNQEGQIVDEWQDVRP